MTKSDRSDDISELFSALVSSRGGLRAGAYVRVWIRGEPDTGRAEVGVWDLSFGAANAAELTLDVCE